MNERERIEKEAMKSVEYILGNGTQEWDGLAGAINHLRAQRIVSLVLRERAAAFESAAQECGWCGECGGQHTIRALAAQERAHAGEGGGRG